MSVFNPPPVKAPKKLTGSDPALVVFFSSWLRWCYLSFEKLRGIKSGDGSPENSVGGNVGDIYRRTDGGASTTLYVKESGAGTTTGWVAK